MTTERKIQISESFSNEYVETELEIDLSEKEFELLKTGIFSGSMEEKWNIFVLNEFIYFLGTPLTLIFSFFLLTILLISIYNNFKNFSKIFLFLQILCFLFAFIFIKSPNIAFNTLYKDTSINVLNYMRTKFFRFLVMINKTTQHATSKVYSLVPLLNFNEEWSDEKLYKKYNITQDEINFIDSMIRPMEVKDE